MTYSFKYTKLKCLTRGVEFSVFSIVSPYKSLWYEPFFLFFRAFFLFSFFLLKSKLFFNLKKRP